MEFKQYPSYKNSGVEWLGDVPEGWSVYPFWHLFKQKEITNKTEEQLLSVYLDRGVILHSEGGGMVHKPAENLEKYQLVEVNDFVMNNQQAWRGSVGVSPHQGIVSPAYLIFKPNKELNPQFSKYQLRDKHIIDQFMISSLSVGTIQRQIKNHLLRVIQVPTPPLDDQQKIVSFLDTETARIDNLINKQQKLIELLEEQRKSIISYAVTKGLNPNAPMKDSGVEWLGEVPDGWDVIKLRWITRGIKTGGTPSIYLPTDEFDEGYIDWFTPSDFKGDFHLKNSQKKVDPKGIANNDLKIIPENSLLLIGIGATLGKVGYITEKASSNQQINYIFLDEKKAGLLFLVYYFFAHNQYTKNMATASTLPILNQQKMGDIFISLPNILEQKEIVEFLDKENNRFDHLITKQKNLIEKLKEYRSSIISHAVTGKIDVREWVA